MFLWDSPVEDEYYHGVILKNHPTDNYQNKKNQYIGEDRLELQNIGLA
jgi:hypothetical protein